MPDNISQDIAISGEGNIVVGKGDVIINPLPPAEARLRHDLGILLKNVETTWIKGVLEKSVHEAALLELGMELREEAVDNPWRMVIEKPDQSREILPQGRKLKDIFNEANRLLLILGEPGSGKTTTLLQLARDLIAEVDSSYTHPIPVILNLSTWTDKQPLDNWIISELNSKYFLPKKQGKQWLEDRRILPLLDGLDEVKVENRAACVEKINRLVTDYGLQGLVVCSRIKDYTDLNVRLAFYRAIYLQPLTFEQIDKYLNQAGDKLASLRGTLQGDEALRNMAQSPLILNIMSLAYQNTSAEALSDLALTTDEARRKHLFDTYIARMFNRKIGARLYDYDNEQTRHRLSWLAQNMKRHNQEVYLIEGLQPSWLSAYPWQWIYFFASRLFSVMILDTSTESPIQGPWRFATFLIVAGLFIGLIDVLRYEWLRNRKALRNSPSFSWSIINIMLVFLIIGLLVGFITDGLIPGLIYGMIFGLLFGLRGRKHTSEIDIETVEALRWSWHEALIGGVIGSITAVIFTLILGSMNVLDFGTNVLLFGLMGVILNGLRREVIETKSSPNQGIRLSIRNAIFVGLLFGLLVGLITGGINVLNQGLSGLSSILNNVLGFGLLGVLWYGGLDVIQHYTLRLILVIQGHTPRNYARFLDYAVDRIFLQKVGGGYRFIHRLLLEHFADMDETTKKV